MFTGIVESLGKILSLKSDSMQVEASFAGELSLGDSVAVNGVCLTATKLTSNSFWADVSPETFSRTAFDSLKVGSRVNLERAMAADGRFGGHIVSGHVDGRGTYSSAQKKGNSLEISFKVGRDLSKYMIEKGSVAVDGISLTIARIQKNDSGAIFTLAVIPHTLERTSLAFKNPGDSVNIECDLVGKYIENFVKEYGLRDESEKNLSDFMAGTFTSFH